MRATLLLLAVVLLTGCQEARSRTQVHRFSTQVAPALAAPVSKKLTRADFDNHVTELKKRLPSKEFSIVIQEPFVVIGDEPEAFVKQRAEDTVKWAVDRLKQDFFTENPEHIMDIWLFKDKTSYEKHTKLLFNDNPTTPFGYYSPAHKALIMNIGTGGGTLVHEIVHPFVEANSTLIQDANFDECAGVLQRRERYKLRTGALPLLLPATKRPAGEVL